MAYDDGRVACTEDAVIIRWYYFPPWDKRIPYQKIEQVRRVQMTAMSGRYRIWGSGDFVHWFNYDPHRPSKSVALIIRVTGHSVRPVITPDNADDVTAELAVHGVNITTG